jgi:hypothetical protein
VEKRAKRVKVERSSKKNKTPKISVVRNIFKIP